MARGVRTVLARARRPARSRWPGKPARPERRAVSTPTAVAGRGLMKTYAADGVPVRAVDDIDLVGEAGETVSVMGPSGGGKSTLLHPLGGLRRPRAGGIARCSG